MYRGHSTAVVVPAYNEAGFVGDTIASVPAFVDRVYAVDDGSTDDTWAEIKTAADVVADSAGDDANATVEDANLTTENATIAEDASATTEDPSAPVDAGTTFDDENAPVGDEDARVVGIQHEQNRGVGGAIKTGYQHARADEIQLTAVMGGDGQMEPEMLGDLFDPIVDGDADYTKGNRFLHRTGRGSMPAHRFVGNAALGALTKIASGYWTAGDPQSGYTAISLHALETAAIDSMYEFYGYCNDLLVKLNVARLRVVDVPRPITYGDEESHIKYRTYVPRVSMMLLRNFGWRLKANYLAYDFHPLVGAYAGGAVSAVAAVAAAVWALPGVGTVGTPIARGAVALGFGLVAVFAFTWAMAMDRDANADLDDAITPAERRRPNGDDGADTVARNGSTPRAVTLDGALAVDELDDDLPGGRRIDPAAGRRGESEESPGPNTASD